MSTPSSLPFKWVGGRPALDFVNTVSGRIHADGADDYTVLRDKLRAAADVTAWAAEAGLAVPAGTPAADLLPRALALREALYRLFRAATLGPTGPGTDPRDLATLSAELEEARAHQRLVSRTGGGFELRSDLPANAAGHWLGPVAVSAAELLTSPDLARVRQCPGEECGFLFVDASRTGRRRWCEMEDCGNRAKVRRFRTRGHEPAPAEPARPPVR